MMRMKDFDNFARRVELDIMNVVISKPDPILPGFGDVWNRYLNK